MYTLYFKHCGTFGIRAFKKNAVGIALGMVDTSLGKPQNLITMNIPRTACVPSTSPSPLLFLRVGKSWWIYSLQSVSPDSHKHHHSRKVCISVFPKTLPIGSNFPEPEDHISRMLPFSAHL